MRIFHVYPAIAVVGLALSALAESPRPDFATWSETSGTVPPPFRTQISFVIPETGPALIEYCKGYQRTENSCAFEEVPITDAQKQSVIDALMQTDLIDRAAAEVADPPVGGGTTSGSVRVEGKTIDLPSFPVDADRPEVETVLSSIKALIPADALARVESRAQAPE
jgi:hypothetical protein